MASRRDLLVKFGLGSLALLAARAWALVALAESDPQAVALGYLLDPKKVDKAKYPKYAEGQHCGSCALFQGKPGDASGPCPLYAGKSVMAGAWCSAWSKKA